MTATSLPLTTADLATVTQLARQLRVDSIRASTSAGSGHPTSSMSAADLLAVLVARHLRYDWEQPKAEANDHLIFSKATHHRSSTRSTRPSGSCRTRS